MHRQKIPGDEDHTIFFSNIVPCILRVKSMKWNVIRQVNIFIPLKLYYISGWQAYVFFVYTLILMYVHLHLYDNNKQKSSLLYIFQAFHDHSDLSELSFYILIQVIRNKKKVKSNIHMTVYKEKNRSIKAVISSVTSHVYFPFVTILT